MGIIVSVNLRIAAAKGKPLCLGVGFVALDIVQGQHGNFAASGGSCGNVMSILSWLGWLAAPVGRIGVGAAGDFVCEEMSNSGVDISHLRQDERVATPIVIQKFVETRDGERTHRYSLSCPDCGGWLPRYRPVTLNEVVSITEGSRRPKAFYFDRVSPAALRLAKWARDLGALVVFEPSSLGDDHSFQKAVDLSHILKYSNERLGHILDLAVVKSPKVVVETMGKEGMRVRWRSRWSHIPSVPAPRFVDAAGSGDWCTAGLIHRLSQQGARRLDEVKKPELEAALRFGQALAAVNCAFEGARGAMLAKTRREIDKALRLIDADDVSLFSRCIDSHETERRMPNSFCDTCSVKVRELNEEKTA